MDSGTISAIFRSSTPVRQGALTLSPGHTLRGQVIEVSAQYMKLRIGGSLLDAKLNDPSGVLRQTFERHGSIEAQFRVVKNHPDVVLKITPETLAKITPQASTFARASLPYQRPLTEFFNTFVAHHKNHSDVAQNSQARPVHAGTDKTSSDLANRLPVLLQLATAAGFKAAFLQSGVMFESLLADWLLKGSPQPREDLKAQLLRIASNLGNSRRTGIHPELRGLSEQIDSALARIETLQLASKQSSDDQKSLIFFEIPYKTDEKVSDIRGYVEQRARQSNGDTTAQTSVGLLIQLSQDQSLLAKIRFDSEGLHVFLWSENERIQRAIRAGREEFECLLSKNQANPVSLKIVPMSAEEFEAIPRFKGLLDDEA